MKKGVWEELPWRIYVENPAIGIRHTYNTAYRTEAEALAAMVVKKFIRPDNTYEVVNTNKKQ
jgi:hypothetical protein